MFDEKHFYRVLNEIPELKRELVKLPDVKSSYHLARCLADYTEHSVENRNHSMCSKCLYLAESALKRGNGPIRNAIRFVFIPVISQLLKYNGIPEEQIPPRLKAELKLAVPG